MSRPFLQLKLQTNQDLLDKLRQLPDRSQRNIRRKIVTELVPYLERRANELMNDNPPMVSSPFAFGGPNRGMRSKLYYFWLIRSNPDLTDGAHWIRTGHLEQGWRFEASDRFRSIQVTGRNVEDKAQYVFGPWLVPGHANTGWPEKVEQVREQLQIEMRRMIARLWREAINEALKGQS